MDDTTVLLGVAGFVLNVIVLLVTMTWKLSKAKGEIIDRINESRSEIDERRERDRREIGETFSALRSHIQHVEIWSRDTFARRDSFAAGIGRIESQISVLDNKITGRLNRLDDKIDGRFGEGK